MSIHIYQFHSLTFKFSNKGINLHWNSIGEWKEYFQNNSFHSILLLSQGVIGALGKNEELLAFGIFPNTWREEENWLTNTDLEADFWKKRTDSRHILSHFDMCPRDSHFYRWKFISSNIFSNIIINFKSICQKPCNSTSWHFLLFSIKTCKIQICAVNYKIIIK